ncbi:jg6164 [Pararge aegeria aegeria]|uniref:Jg6164 protein n=2 Tax=Pararge aegeria TaxID=116150 RepID=A0A8S4RPV2_9NEOP|nr:jg6164 [Pararge aegeria aegeria]
MGSLRSCVFLLVIFVQLQHIAGKPLFFTDLFCDYMCDDDDVSTTTTASNEDDDWDIFGLCTCGTRRPPGVRRGQGFPANINMRLPPSANGMNFSMNNANGAWNFQLDAGPNGPNGPFSVVPIGGPTIIPAGAGGSTTAATITTTSTTAKA